MQIPRAHSKPAYQNHRECDLEICTFSKQGILRLLQVCLTVPLPPRVRVSEGSFHQGVQLWRKGSQHRQVERKRLGFHPEARDGKSEDEVCLRQYLSSPVSRYG